MESACDWVVLDIEGTTSPTASIKTGLYDYARRWISSHPYDPAVLAAGGLTVLSRWMDNDVKATPLKALQGQIWAAGFAAGDLTAEFFPDVAPALRAWHAAGVKLAVFSSGSVTSQRCWFASGGLAELIDGWFDTANAGPKQEPASYEKIAAALGERPGRILFLTDSAAEIAAARAAGWQAVGVARPGEPHTAPDGVCDLRDAGVGTGPAGGRIAAEAARLAGLGWMCGTSGNISEVISREPLRLAITASGLDKAALTAADVIRYPADGSRKPSAEAALHARIAGLTQADAVIHVHTLSAVAAAARWPHGIVLRDLEMLKGIGRAAHYDEVTIPVIANSQDMTELAGRFAASYDPRTPLIVVAGHGLYAWGADLTKARHVTECADWLLRYALA